MAEAHYTEVQAFVWRREEPRRWTKRHTAALALVILGGLLMATPLIGEWFGDWSQYQQAVEVDAARTRYLWATEAGYASQSAAFEDSLVSFEVGARPIDARGIELPPTVTAQEVSRPVVESPPGTAAPPDEPEPVHTDPPLAIRIPVIEVDQAVVEGVGRSDLRNGPGHYPGTALPGQPGNMVISGHRTTYTKPFHDLDLLVTGDSVFVDTASGTFEYVVVESWVVEPDNVTPLAATAEPALTLTTCTPKGSARQRLIVRALLVDPGYPKGTV